MALARGDGELPGLQQTVQAAELPRLQILTGCIMAEHAGMQQQHYVERMESLVNQRLSDCRVMYWMTIGWNFCGHLAGVPAVLARGVEHPSRGVSGHPGV